MTSYMYIHTYIDYRVFIYEPFHQQSAIRVYLLVTVDMAIHWPTIFDVDIYIYIFIYSYIYITVGNCIYPNNSLLVVPACLSIRLLAAGSS